jgi:uncharacterized protein (DUF3084 family)
MGARLSEQRLATLLLEVEGAEAVERLQRQMAVDQQTELQVRHAPLRALSSVTQRARSITQRDTRFTQRALSVNQRARSVTQRALSVTQRALSVTQRALSVTQRALSVTQRALSVTQRALSATQRSTSPPPQADAVLQQQLATQQRMTDTCEDNYQVGTLSTPRESEQVESDLEMTNVNDDEEKRGLKVLNRLYAACTLSHSFPHSQTLRTYHVCVCSRRCSHATTSGPRCGR